VAGVALTPSALPPVSAISGEKRRFSSLRNFFGFSGYADLQARRDPPDKRVALVIARRPSFAKWRALARSRLPHLPGRILHCVSSERNRGIDMPKPFYRRTESDLATGAANLIAIVTPSVTSFGLTAGELTAYTTLSTNYSTALATATTPSTRTSVTIEAKNIAKKFLMDATINIARTITAVPTVTNAQLLSLGLLERIIPQPRPVPATPPVIEVISVSGRLVTVRIHDGATESRKKPFGAIGANVFSYVGTEAPTDPAVYHYEGMATRAKTQLMFPDSVASGATVWLSAQWVSARGQLGVGSTPISFTLQGGLIPVAA
jgi:hypothetical protein